MLYKDREVSLPDARIYKANGYAYLHLENIYLPDKKYNKPVRVCIGKFIDDETMHPNDNYYKYFPDEDALPDPDPECADSMKVGAKAVVDKIFEDLNLDKILQNVFGSQTAHMIHDLASYLCIDGSSVMQHYPTWRYEHPGNIDTNVSDSTITRMLQGGVSFEESSKFMQLWNEGRDKEGIVYINYDSTNMGCEAEGVELAEYGHAKDDPTLPQVNLAVGAECSTGLPLLYDIYPGSVVDVSEIDYSINLAKGLGIQNLGFVLDRGYLSAENMKKFRKEKYNFVIMLKVNNACANRNIIKYHDELVNTDDPNTLISKYDTYGITVKDKLFSTDEEESWIHVFYDSKRASKEKIEFFNVLKLYEQQIIDGIKKENLTEERAKKFGRYFDLQLKDGKVVGYSQNLENIHLAMRHFGCFAIATTEEMTAEEALTIYRDRDAVEKLFASIKNEMDGFKFRVHSDPSVATKVFIYFIASIIRSRLFFNLRTLRNKTNDNKNYTVNAAIKELDKIMAIKFKDEDFKRIRKLTKRSKNILKCFDMSEVDIDEYINNTLN